MRSLIPWKKNEVASNDWQGRQWHPLAKFQQDFNELMDRFWHDWPSFAGDNLDLDLRDEKDEYVLRAEAPGFDAEDFDIHVSGNQFVLRAERNDESSDNGGKSFHYGRIDRSFPLPVGVKEDAIDAKYHNGVLEVHLPKDEKARGKRIEVKAG